MTNDELVSWDNLTREIELPPYEEWEHLPTPDGMYEPLTGEEYNEWGEQI